MEIKTFSKFKYKFKNLNYEYSEDDNKNIFVDMFTFKSLLLSGKKVAS